MKHNETPAPAEQPPNAQTIPSQPEAAAYRRPQVYALGTAAELIRRSISGHLIDGNGGWWVWGS